MELSLKTIAYAILVPAALLSVVLLYAARKTTEKAGLQVDMIQDVRGLGYSGQRKIATDGKGNIFVAYRKKYQGKSEIFIAKIRKQENDWSVSGTEKPIACVGTGVDQRVPSIDIDSENVIHAVWYGADSDAQTDNRQIKYSRSRDGGRTWSDWKNISPVDGYRNEDYWQEHPHIIAGKNNFLFSAWEGKDQDNGKQQIKFSRSADGGMTWSRWKNIRTTPDNTQSRPTIVQDRSGRLHIFMYSSFANGTGRQQIAHSWSDDEGNSWNAWQAVSDPAFDSRHISSAVGPDGESHIAWRSQDSSGRSQIMYRFLKNGRWSEIQAVAPSGSYQFFPSIGIDGDGKPNVVWMESEKPSDLPNENPPDGKIRIARLEAGAFSPIQPVADDTPGLYPHIPEKSEGLEIPLIFESLRPKEYALFLRMIPKDNGVKNFYQKIKSSL